MPFLPVRPDDADRIACAVEITNLSRQVDDPDAVPAHPVLMSRMLRYGWDLEPDNSFLYVPEGSSSPVGVLDLGMPERDNRHTVWGNVLVHPEHRRRGHGSAMAEEVLRRAREAGRPTIWLETASDDRGGRAFLEGFGFVRATCDARRRQQLAEVDRAAVQRLHEEAVAAAGDYVLERGQPPTPDDVLREMIEVTAAINDAPMGDLTFEPEVFDLDRLRAFETAAAGRGDTVYQVRARHRSSGVVAGHTIVTTNPLRPGFGVQADTAVHREHRGHRLGLLLKTEMLRWLAEVEPGLELLETWNNTDNAHMISVNEALGYRLSRVYCTYELTLRG